jgi:hypothetical protein
MLIKKKQIDEAEVGTPTHHVRGARPRRLGVLVRLLPPAGRGLCEAHHGLERAAQVALGVRRDGAHEPRAGLGRQVGLLDLALGGVLRTTNVSN